MRRLEHADLAHILASESLWSDSNLDLLAGNDLRIEHCRRIVSGIAAAHRVLYNRFPKISLVVTAAHTLVNRIRKIASGQVYILPDLKEYARHTRILADRHALSVCNLEVLDDVIQNAFGDLSVLARAAILDRTLHVFRKMLIRFDTKLLYDIRNLAYFYLTHNLVSFFHSYPCGISLSLMPGIFRQQQW